uniref:Uncharacterized protein n=1 Tax=virus sp. ctK6s94 TaxID=2826798 RepID=A0A8S5MFF1_9VIRU|nr:MAG TPA: hypothetical protein [virus sp. ctK6s94]
MNIQSSVLNAIGSVENVALKAKALSELNIKEANRQAKEEIQKKREKAKSLIGDEKEEKRIQNLNKRQSEIENAQASRDMIGNTMTELQKIRLQREKMFEEMNEEFARGEMYGK